MNLNHADLPLSSARETTLQCPSTLAHGIAEAAAPIIAEHVVRILGARGSLTATGISSRAGREGTWRDDQDSQGLMVPTDTENDGESTWSMNEANRLLSLLKRKSKRKK
jgi:hypothetical protein